METNDFLLYNEIIYHIHTCQDMRCSTGSTPAGPWRN